MSQLEQLFTDFGTDKGAWGYTPAYEEHLGPMRENARNILEIGICGFRDIPNNVVGASLFAWRDYFPNATIHGLDNDGRFIFNDQPRIKTSLTDAYDVVSLMQAISSFDVMYDFICDDAVHDPMWQMWLIRKLWGVLSPGGIYAIEEACPYKVPHGDLYQHMVSPLMREIPDMTAVEYRTHKEERLLIFKKTSTDR